MTGSTEAKKENIILCVARMVKEKRIDALLQVWNAASRQLPDWQFIVVGDGEERQALEKKVTEQNILHVEFTGFANPTPYYRKAKIFWMASQFEGWGMTILEAMQQGCVPIAFNTFTSLADIIDNNENGYVIKEKDIKTFVEKTIKVAEDEPLFQQLSTAARQKTHKFDIENVMKQWNVLFNT